MDFDFTTVVNRKDTGSIKWNNAQNKTKQDLLFAPLSVADMEFVCCPSVKKEILNALNDTCVMGYTSNPKGYEEAVIKWMKEEHNLDIEKEWIIQTYGVIQALYQAINCFTEEGDGIIIQTPVYHQFKLAIENTNRKCVDNPLKIENDNYIIDFDDLRTKAKQAKMLILCSPHNPVGRIWTIEELETVRDICEENNLIVIADEIHFDFELKRKHNSFLRMYPNRVILCTSPSKTFNLAGLNFANIIIENSELRQQYKNQLDRQGIHFQNYFGYYATMGAYSHEGKLWKDSCNQVIIENYKYLKTYFANNFPLVNVYELEGTYLSWIDMNGLGLSEDELVKILEDSKIFIDAGSKFGENGTGFIRINLACPQSVLEIALDQMKKALCNI